MSIFDAEIASRFGAVDSDRVADGEAFGADLLRAVSMGANRLLTKGAMGPCLPWPLISRDELGSPAFEAVALPEWRVIHPPIPWPKMPGLSRADARIRIAASVGDIEVKILTSTMRSLQGSEHLISVPVGAMALRSLDGFRVSPGAFDLLEVWVRGDGTTTLGDTGAHGVPNTGTDFHIADKRGVIYRGHPTRAFDASPGQATPSTWVVGGNDWARAGHWVGFFDSANRALLAPRRIVSVPSPHEFIFSPELTDDEAIYLTQRVESFSIFRLPSFELGSMAFRLRGLTE